jgi:hypothetical protein
VSVQTDASGPGQLTPADSWRNIALIALNDFGDRPKPEGTNHTPQTAADSAILGLRGNFHSRISSHLTLSFLGLPSRYYTCPYILQVTLP